MIKRVVATDLQSYESMYDCDIAVRIDNELLGHERFMALPHKAMLLYMAIPYVTDDETDIFPCRADLLKQYGVRAKNFIKARDDLVKAGAIKQLRGDAYILNRYPDTWGCE